MPAIDVLRGLAALAVMLFHSLNVIGSPASHPVLHPILSAIRHATGFGYLGVSVFFAISGWCIAQRVRSAWVKREPTGRFLLERALRIFPVYWCALLVAIGLRVAASFFNQHSLSQTVPAGPLATIGDILLIQPYLGTPAFLLVSWSLVYELGYYLVAGAALSARQRGVSTVWLMAAGFGLAVWSYFPHTARALVILHYWPDFFAGMVAWQASRLTGRSKWILASLGLVALAALSRPGWTEPHRVTAIATAILMLVFARSTLRDTPISRAALGLGAMSYSLYLIHICAISPWNNLAQHYVSPGSLGFVGLWLIGLALGLAMGWALHRYCEAPIERWRRGLFTAKESPAFAAVAADVPENS